jgi:hypothetical protein
MHVRKPQRPFYTTGMLLDAQDFSDEQTYHRGRLAQAIAFHLWRWHVGWFAGGAPAREHDTGTPEEIRVELV